MLIVCPTCVSSYRIDSAILRHAQGTVRCAHCREAWVIDAGSGDMAGTTGSWRSPAAPLGARTTPSTSALLPLPADPISSSPVGMMMFGMAIVALGMMAVGWRMPLMRALPAVTPLFASLGFSTADATLTLADLTTATLEEGSTRVLQLEGQIANGLAASARVPNIRIVVRDAAAQPLYSWTAPAPKARLAPGETVAFKSRLVAPPGNGHDVEVAFTDARAFGADAVVKGSK